MICVINHSSSSAVPSSVIIINLVNASEPINQTGAYIDHVRHVYLYQSCGIVYAVDVDHTYYLCAIYCKI